MTPADCIKDGMVRCQDCTWFRVVRRWRDSLGGRREHYNRWSCMKTGCPDGPTKYANGKTRPGASLAKHRWRRCDHFEVKRGIGGYPCTR